MRPTTTASDGSFAARARRPLAFLALTLGTALALPACASAPVAPTPASPVATMDALWLPALEQLTSPDAFALTRVDMRALTATPLFAHVEQRLADLVYEDWSAADVAYTRELAHRVDELVWAVEGVPGGPLDDTTVLLRGRFSAADLERLSDTHESATYEGHPVRADGAWSLALLGDHTLALGPLHLVEGTCDRFDGRRPLGPAMHPALIAARTRAGYGEHTLTYAVRSQPSEYASAERYEEAIVSYEGYCDVAGGIACDLGVTVSDSDALAPLEESLQRVLDVFTGQTPVFRIPPAVATMAQGVAFRTEGRRLVAHLHTDEPGARETVDGLLRLVTTHMNSLIEDPRTP